MNEKGISPPPKPDLAFEDLQRAKLDLLAGHMNQMDKWLRTLSAVFPRTQTYESSLSPASVPAGSTSEQSFTINGLQTRDIVYVNKPTHQLGLGVVGARVSADNTIAITFMNVSGGAIVPTAAETYYIVSTRR